MARKAKRKPPSPSRSPNKAPKLETPQNQEVKEEDDTDLVPEAVVHQDVVAEAVVVSEALDDAEMDDGGIDSVFIEESRVPRRKWHYRYLPKTKKVGDATFDGVDYMRANKHYTQALIDGRVHFKLGDDGYVQAPEDQDRDQDSFIYIIIEMFEGVDCTLYFRGQCNYLAKDTVIGACDYLIDNKRIFLSEVKDDNPLYCLLQKIKTVRVPPNVEVADKLEKLGDGAFCYDMAYLVPFSTYQCLPPDNEEDAYAVKKVTPKVPVIDQQV